MAVITRWSYKRGGRKAGFHCIRYFIGVYSSTRSCLFLVRLLVGTNSTNGYFKDRFENKCSVINQSVVVSLN